MPLTSLQDAASNETGATRTNRQVYALTLTPGEVRAYLLASAEEIDRLSRFQVEKEFQKKYWVRFSQGRPNLQLKAHLRNEYTGWFSWHSPWVGIEIQQAPHGSNAELIWQTVWYARWLDAAIWAMFLLFLILFIGLLAASLRQQAFSWEVLLFSAFWLFFIPYLYYLKKQQPKMIAAETKQVQEMLDAAFRPYSAIH